MEFTKKFDLILDNREAIKKFKPVNDVFNVEVVEKMTDVQVHGA